MNLTTFDFNAAPVRVMMRDDQPWFVAADVCRVLEIANPRDAVSGLDEDEKMTVANTDGHSGQRGGAQSFNLISESGLYALAFKSRKPEAKTFRKWVTAEVLPALRQTGKYEVLKAQAKEERISLWHFVREVGASWSLERQIDFGRTARRWVKSMGVLFEVDTVQGLGRVFTFPRSILEDLRRDFLRVNALPDSDTAEFEKLLEAAWRMCGTEPILPETMRGLAKTLGLFPSIFQDNTSLASERSGFGRLVERFDGAPFPNGLALNRVMRPARRYQLQQVGLGPALAA